MLPEKYQWIEEQFEPEGDPWLLLTLGRELEEDGNREGAATVYDRAYGLDPANEEVRVARARVLDALAVVEHGLKFRYIPGGPFLMGCNEGEPDERPWHPVWLSPFWLAEAPVSWGAYCRLMGWAPPPTARLPEGGGPAGVADQGALFILHNINKIRLQYCEDQTTRAVDWHAHLPEVAANPTRAGFGVPPRTDPTAPWSYENKPMVAAAWQDALELADRLSTKDVLYHLPTEAQWEKAARGGLIGGRHAWGEEPPDAERCDFNRFGAFSLLPMRTFPANGYGLYAMNGCVWEWVRDWYDRDYYRTAADRDPEGPAQGEERVLRGGSWSDCAEVVTVTFRMSRASAGWREGFRQGASPAPNVGFRLCRTVRRA
jgi:formylglycine-generating enzyme required for sulfatase activity